MHPFTIISFTKYLGKTQFAIISILVVLKTIIIKLRNSEIVDYYLELPQLNYQKVGPIIKHYLLQIILKKKGKMEFIKLELMHDFFVM